MARGGAFVTRALVTAVALWAVALRPAMAVAADPRVEAVQLLIERGHYDEAEAASDTLVSSLAVLPREDRLRARQLQVEARIRNGHGADAGTLLQARSLIPPAGAAPDAPSVRLLGRTLLESGEYRAASVRFLEALRIDERTLGPLHDDVAEDLDALTRAYIWLERHDDALAASSRALAIREQAGRSRDALSRTLTIRGLLWHRRGDQVRARADFQRAMDIQDVAAAADHPDRVELLTLYGDQLNSDGEFQRAIVMLERALSIAERSLREGHPDTALVLRSLAEPLFESGQFDRARALRERAVAITERACGPRHPLLASTLNDLAISVAQRGDYLEARRLQRRAQAIFEERLGPSHSYVTTTVFNLGNRNANLGDFEEAVRLFQRAARTWARVVGPDHVNVARAYVALAEALSNLGRDGDAVRFLERALAIREQRLGATHWRVATVLTAMSGSLARLGDLDGAERASDRALSILKDAKRPESLSEALLVRGRLALTRGDFMAASDHFAQVLAIREPLFGSAHPSVAEARAGRATALAGLGLLDDASDGALLAEDVGRSHLRLTLEGLSERQALRYAASRPQGRDLALSLVPRTYDGRRTLDAVIRGRSLVLDEIGARQYIREGAADPQLAPLFAALASARQRLANVAVRGAEGMSAAQYEALLDGARRDKEAAETALAERSALARQALTRKEVGLDAVRAALPARIALVSFVRYDRSTFPAPGATGPAARIQKAAAYLAFVLRVDTSEPTVVDLGPARSLDAAIARWRRDLANGITPDVTAAPGAERALRTVGISLRQRVWDPVAAHLADVDQVFVVPDGALNLLPLAALPADATRYLVETGPTIHYLSAERDLVREAPARAARGLLALGGPAYGNTGGQAPPAIATTAQRRSVCGTLETITFPLLPASGIEAEDVTAVWRRAGAAAAGEAEPALILTGANATEAAFKRSSPGRRILHLATHGYFLDQTCETPPAATVGPATSGANGSRGAPAKRPAALFPGNPLLLSGLALARANYRSTAGRRGEDGILTAEEVAGLDLDGVEWAVLSACDTGLGKIEAGEGVMGLRRAFQIAGVRTIVMSLWAVEDQAGRAWMRALYEARLTAGKSTADAVRGASPTVLR